MNEFVLLLWAADVVGSVGITAFMAAFTIGVTLLFLHIVDEMPDGFYDRHGKKLSIFAAFFMSVMLLPSPTTIHTYAALTATKDIAETQIGKKALAALDAKFDDIIEGSRDE